MKRLWLVLTVAMLLGFGVLMAQDIHWADQKTIEWDCPTQTNDGEPISTDLVFATRVFLRYEDGTGIEMIDEVPSVVGATEQYIVTIPTGVYEVGVMAVIYMPGSSTGLVSNMLWSKDTSSPFLLGNAAPPAAHSDIRIVP